MLNCEASWITVGRPATGTVWRLAAPPASANAPDGIVNWAGPLPVTGATVMSAGMPPLSGRRLDTQPLRMASGPPQNTAPQIEFKVPVFAREVEPRLRYALVAAVGQDLGQDAACEALAYGWRHWDRIRDLENPAGYLYRVGRRSVRRCRRQSMAGQLEQGIRP